MMNLVVLIGNLTADPENRTTPNGVANCTFRLAVQRRYANAQGNRETDFFNVVCWRQLAENCARYLAKGRKVAVKGELQTRSYDAQDGTKRYVTEIIADSVEFLNSGERQAAPDAQAAPTQVDTQTGFTEVDDDTLPFD